MFVELVTIPRLHVSSSELLVPRSKLRNQVVKRHFSCRVYPPQLSTTTVVWVGASYHSRTKSLQYTRWQSGDCPTDHTRCQTRDKNAHRVTARRLSATCLKVCYTNSGDEQQSHSTTDQSSSPLTESPVIPESTQIWFPFYHSLTSSTEVLAKRLIGTCA